MDGEVKIVITPQLVHDIFEEFPIVAKAYNDNVPNKVERLIFLVWNRVLTHAKLSEAEFWSRYFQSKLFNAHRASIRSSAAQHVVKDDPIFDKYLEKDDDGGCAYILPETCIACANSSLNLPLTVLKVSNPEDHGQKPSACSLISQQRLKTTAKYV